MQLPLALQTVQFLLSALLGVSMSLLYDVFRAIRGRVKAACLLDGLFGLVLVLGMLLFALYPGRGEFRIFMYIGMLFGVVFYFLTLSPFVMRFLSLLARAVSKLLHLIGRVLKKALGFVGRPVLVLGKKIKKTLKSLFSYCSKWVRIVFVQKRKHRNPAATGGASHEIQTVFISHQDDHLDSCRIRYDYPGVSADPNRTKASAGRRPPSPKPSRKISACRRRLIRWIPMRASQKLPGRSWG